MRIQVEQFWSDFFGIGLAELQQPGVRVVAHRGLGDYPGAWIFWRGDAVLVSTPQALVASTRAGLAADTDLHRDPEGLTTLFTGRTERVIGPAYQGYLGPAAFRPHLGEGAGAVPVDGDFVASLQAECEPVEWSHAGIEPERPEPCFGYSVNQRGVAVAQNAFWAETVVSPGLIVHPDHRGRGYGRAVLSAAAAAALQRGHLVLYQTLVSNIPAIRAAEALGFAQFATHLAIRFRD